MIAPLFVGRKKSIGALEEVMRSDTFVMLATQKNASDDDPATEAIYEVGTLASVLQLLKLPDGTVKVLVEGAQRAKVVKYTDCSEYYEAEAIALGDTMGERVEAEALARSATTEFESYVKLNKKVPPEVVGVVQQIEDHAKSAVPRAFPKNTPRLRLGCGEIVAVGKGWRGVPSGIPIMLGAGWGTSRPRQWHGTPPRAPVPRVRQHCEAARGEPSIGGTTASATAPEGTGPAPSPCYTTAVIVSSSRQRRRGAAERLNDDLGYDGSASTFLLRAQDEKSGSSIEGPQRHRGLFAFPPHSSIARTAAQRRRSRPAWASYCWTLVRRLTSRVQRDAPVRVDVRHAATGSPRLACWLSKIRTCLFPAIFGNAGRF